MRIRFLKMINEIMPSWVKQPFAKIIRKKLINNKVFLETYQWLETAENMSPEEKKDWQLAKAKEILQHAYHHSMYYRMLFDESGFKTDSMNGLTDLQRIPVLTKQILTQRLEEIVADDISDFYAVTTAGTSGAPTMVLMGKHTIYKEWAFIYHYWAKFGYEFKCSKLATFRGVNLGSKICEINPLYSEIRMNPFIMNKRNIKTYLDKIDSYGADFIYGYPSAIYNFCRLIQEEGLQVRGRFKAAFMISENLYPFQEEMITIMLGCKIAMFYGHSERAVFAEKYEDGYHFNSFYGITEFSSEGEPIVTGFINDKTPLVRYVMDDEVKPTDTDVYDIVGHRGSEVLYGSNGERISMAAINFHDNTFEGISSYQFVQAEIGRCILRVVSDEKLGESRIRNMEKRIMRKLGDGLSCSVSQVESLELAGRGKYKMVIQNCGKE